MKSLLLAGTAIVAFVTAASAADLAARPYTKAPAAPARTHNWTGCYAGGHVGAGWSKPNLTDPPGVLSVNGSFDVKGDASVLGGVQLGCDYQFANAWVIGLAGDFSGTSIKGTANDPFFGNKNPGPAQIHTRTDWLASLSGRAGYAWDNVLLYGKGGVVSHMIATALATSPRPGVVSACPAGASSPVTLLETLLGLVGSPVPASNGHLRRTGRRSLSTITTDSAKRHCLSPIQMQ